MVSKAQQLSNLSTGESVMANQTPEEINKEKLYDAAMGLYGIDAQFVMAIEECSELIQAIIKYMRYPQIDKVLNVKEEICDVEIMLEQIRRYFDKRESKQQIGSIDKMKKIKLARLHEMLVNDGVNFENSIEGDKNVKNNN